MAVSNLAISLYNMFKDFPGYHYSRLSYVGNTSLRNLSRAYFRKFGENDIVGIIYFTTKISQYSGLYKYLGLNSDNSFNKLF